MPKNEESSSHRNRVSQLLRWVLLAIVGLVIWNGRLLWNVSKPLIVTYGGSDPAPLTELAEKDLGENRFLFPRLGISAPLHERPNTSPFVVQDWKQLSADLKEGVSLSYQEASLENAGYAFVSGHSSDTYPHTYSSVFAGLNQAVVGDTFAIIVNKQLLQYKVVEKRKASPSDVQAFLPSRPTEPPQEVLLVTCWPLLSTKQRLIILGERMSE